ncbi:MAG: hypothetical protein Ta2F_00250 [Termitinemataceae bacterium]|nr:MAG: hypothetical protein Ta2F_00250 [Termitinemataceae bacterium]
MNNKFLNNISRFSFLICTFLASNSVFAQADFGYADEFSGNEYNSYEEYTDFEAPFGNDNDNDNDNYTYNEALDSFAGDSFDNSDAESSFDDSIGNSIDNSLGSPIDNSIDGNDYEPKPRKRDSRRKIEFLAQSLDLDTEAGETDISEEIYGSDEETTDDGKEAKSKVKIKPSKKTKNIGDPSAPELWAGLRKKRYFELGIVGLEAGLDNSIFTFKEAIGALKEEAFFDPNNIKGDFTFNLDIFTKPIYFKINSARTIDFEFFTGAALRVYGDISGDTISSLRTLQGLTDTSFNFEDIDYIQNLFQTLQTINGSVNAAASFFAEIGVSGAKTILNNRLWIKVSPAVFFTAYYMPNAGVELKSFGGDMGNPERFMGMRGSGAIDIYSAFDISSHDYARMLASPGFDISLEGRFALFRIVDIGLLVQNIPIFPSTTHYRSGVNLDVQFSVPNPTYKGWTPEELAHYLLSGVGFAIPDITSMVQEPIEESKLVHRPVHINSYLLFKPFKTHLFVIKPNFGVSINSVIAPLLFNYGLEFQLNLPKILSINIGSGVNEKNWRNKAVFELDFRVFEFDIGAALQGPTFVDSWKRNGLAAIVGFKFGY